MENKEKQQQQYWKDLHCLDCDHYGTISGNNDLKHPYCFLYECRVAPHFKSCEAFSVKDGELNGKQ